RSISGRWNKILESKPPDYGPLLSLSENQFPAQFHSLRHRYRPY
ncbi:MAG: hypothetical protein ACI9PP_001834, partial [Halobacteriales archaeon]